MGEVTQADQAQLERRLEHIEALAEGIMHSLIGQEKRKTWLKWWNSEDERLRREFARKWENETPIYKLGIPQKAVTAIDNALGQTDPYWALVTVEELTDHSRAEVAAIRGVGPRTMAKLDAAVGDCGLVWAEAA